MVWAALKPDTVDVVSYATLHGARASLQPAPTTITFCGMMMDVNREWK
jgi:hypothetical protein